MKYAAMLAASLVFVVIGHFRTQRKKHAEMERQEFKAAADRAERRENQR